MNDSLYGWSSGESTSFDKKVQANAAGEFGLLFAGKGLNLKIGVELLLPKEIGDIQGTNAAGTKLFALSSKALAYMPTVGLEFVNRPTATSRVVVGAGYGIAFATIDNVYTLTSTGTTELGVGDYTESAKGQGDVYIGYVSYEFLFTDTVTLSGSLGYRYGSVTSFKSTKATTAITGEQGEGTELKNHGGSNRSLDLGGPYAGLAFRFYL